MFAGASDFPLSPANSAGARTRMRFSPRARFDRDMSRGGLMLRCAAEDRELDYVAVDGAVRRGARPPKLTPRNWGFKITEGITRIAP